MAAVEDESAALERWIVALSAALDVGSADGVAQKIFSVPDSSSNFKDLLREKGHSRCVAKAESASSNESWLAALLGEALDKSSPVRSVCVNSIMSLPDQAQVCLMRLVEDQMQLRKDPRSPVPQTSPFDSATPTSVKEQTRRPRSSGCASREDQERSRAKVARLEEEVQQLVAQLSEAEERNAAMSEEVEGFKKELLAKTLEESIQRSEAAEESTQRWQKKIEELQEQLVLSDKRAREAEARAANAQAIQDELELLRPLSSENERLNNALERTRKALEEAGDVKAALRRETEEREAQTQRAIQAEAIASTLPSVQASLTEARARAAEAEMEVRNLRKKHKDFVDTQEQMFADKDQELLELQQKSLEPQRVLPEADSNENEECNGMGLSELNPQIASRIALLEKENERLQEHLGNVDEAAVTRLREEAEKTKLMIQKYEEIIETRETELQGARECIEDFEKKQTLAQVKFNEMRGYIDRGKVAYKTLKVQFEVLEEEFADQQQKKDRFQRQAARAVAEAERARREAMSAGSSNADSELAYMQGNLQKELEQVLKENRSLKKRITEVSKAREQAEQETSLKKTPTSSLSGGAVRVAVRPGSGCIASPQYRESLEQFEAEIDRERNSRRQALLQLNAAISDKHKAERAVQALREELQKANEKARKLQLRCERAGHDPETSKVLSGDSIGVEINANIEDKENDPDTVFQGNVLNEKELDGEDVRPECVQS